MKKYVVRDGDTMWAISKRTGVRLNLLMAANPQLSDPMALSPGQIIMIPELTKKKHDVGKPMPTSSYQPSAAPSETPPLQTSHHGYVKVESRETTPAYFGFVWPHVVRSNETWDTIAAQYGLSQHQLQHLNPTDTPNALHEGDVLYIPALGPVPKGMKPSTVPMPAPSYPQPGWDGIQPPMMPTPGYAEPGWEGIQPPMMPVPGYPEPGWQGTQPPMMPPQGYPGQGWQEVQQPMPPGTAYGGRPWYDGFPYRGVDDDDWEWQVWGWSDVPFTSYELPTWPKREDD
jgi:LysM repeat protein